MRLRHVLARPTEVVTGYTTKKNLSTPNIKYKKLWIGIPISDKQIGFNTLNKW